MFTRVVLLNDIGRYFLWGDMGFRHIQRFAAIGLIMGAALLPEYVWADCNNLDNNQQWNTLQNKFGKLIKEGKNKEAIDVGRELERICNESPMLNYSMGMLYRRNGENINALTYLKRATQQAQGVDVGEKNLENIWYARFEVEHADSFCSMDEFNEQTKIIEQKNNEIISLNQKLADSSESGHSEFFRNNVLLWTGVGISALGVAMTSIGVVLIVNDNKNIKSIKLRDDQNYNVELDTKFELGWGALGIGIGTLVAGAVMMGIGGYGYTHPTHPNIEITDDVAMNWNFRLNGIDLGLSF